MKAKCSGLIACRARVVVHARTSKKAAAPTSSPKKPASSSKSDDSRVHARSLAKAAAKQVKRIARLRAEASTDEEWKEVEDAEQMKPFVTTLMEQLNARDPASNERRMRSRGVKKGAAMELLNEYSSVFVRALDLELAEEWTESEERLRNWSRERLQDEGAALFDLTAAPDGLLYKNAILKFFMPGRPMPFHSFSQGDILLLTPGDEPSDESVEGVVVDFSSRWLRVAVPADIADTVQGNGWRLDLYANTISYERSRAAVEKFCMPMRGDEAHLGSEQLQRMLAGTLPSGSTLEEVAALSPSWMGGKEGKERLAAAKQVLNGLSEQLNPSQVRAIRTTLTRRLTLWQGPPGTGKTRTLLRFVLCALACFPKGSAPILATAASNVAVDNLVTGLLELGVKVVRIGSPIKVAAELRDRVSLDALVLETPQGKRAAVLRAQARAVKGAGGYELVQEALKLEMEAAKGIVANAEVVACTCIGAGDPVLEDMEFPLCVLDEATQANEPHSLVPIMNKVESLLLVGDPQQLPPTIKSQAALNLGLNITLLERLQTMGLDPLLLDTQYRMHPTICEFPSSAFYGRRLKSFPTPEDRPMVPGFAWPAPQVPVCMLSVDHPESRTSATAESGMGYSYFNDGEADLVIRTVQQLVAAGQLPQGVADIGVITPYMGQVRALKQRISKLSSLTDLEIKSVDGFQGREKEVIVLSTVRSNEQRRVGFLADYRRLNVAITRAKRGLIIIGNPDTLTADKVWLKWIRWAKEKDIIMISPQDRQIVHTKQ